MGRQLPELFIDSGLKNIQVTPSVSMVRDFDKLCSIFNFKEIIDEAVESKSITSIQGKTWLDNMSIASSKGKFMYSIIFYTVQGCKI